MKLLIYMSAIGVFIGVFLMLFPVLSELVSKMYQATTCIEEVGFLVATISWFIFVVIQMIDPFRNM